jgi:hypothetical protein
MKRSLRLGGWWRLWIFLSAVWLAISALLGFSSWPVEDHAPHHPALLYQLEPKQRELLATEGSQDVGTEVEIPNGHVLLFKPGVDKASMTPVAKSYLKAAAAARSIERTEHVQTFLLVGLAPPAIIALLGLGVAWVRRGFTAQAERGLTPRSS